MKRLLIVATLLVASGCTRTEAVYLKNQAGDVVQCGPYSGIPATHQTMLLQLRYCVEDYQRQGYERIPAASA